MLLNGVLEEVSILFYINCSPCPHYPFAIYRQLTLSFYPTSCVIVAMNNHSAKDPQREGSHQNQDHRRMHITDRPPRHQVTHRVYNRLPGSIPSAPLVWEHSEDSSSAQGRSSSAGLSQRQANDRIEEWMERMNTNEPKTSSRKASTTTTAAAGMNPFSFNGVNPNTATPSVVESHYSGESLPSRPTSVCPPPVLRRPAGQEPVVLLPPGFVPPERRAERERANQVIVVENSERRRRRRRERDGDRRRHH
ncbi:uncharacterized protein F4807DRAFT_254706 [Annulohypoxylon truncatum]|uniref:uncharacterized protein n=1 Tax=Annulohypoxylon truncatum TaxID=327061 RepID=UPI0020083C3A|nr:uncharacterized protein F4807DRAFT_254706 [Annulohypoxylon truncatum]KAI1205868.1 hypothetical protein F4807DRAFT_254706 [Annulohypoxylon truncatum]